MNDLNLSGLQVDNIQNIVDQSVGQGIDDGSFIWGIFFSIIGMSYLMYGKRSDKDMFLYSGIGLVAYTYFATGMTQTVAIGVVLTVIPFVIKR